MRLDTPEGINIEPSRRSIAASLFVPGYAAAALSACATPVTTPTDELVTEDVHFTGHAGYNLPAYVARPARRGRHHPVIVVNEIFGIHEYIKDTCRRFAREGYVAIAPDFFDRAGDPAPLTEMAAIRAIVNTATNEQVMGDTGGAIEFVKRQNYANANAYGITGFCWGGTVVWMASARFSEIKAGVAWYGRVARPATSPAADPNRQWPVDIAAQLKAPVLGLYGANDQGIPVSTVEEMRTALAANGNPTRSEIIVYPNSGHGFHADYRASYNATDAADGWTRLLAWYRANGVT